MTIYLLKRNIFSIRFSIFDSCMAKKIFVFWQYFQYFFKFVGRKSGNNTNFSSNYQKLQLLFLKLPKDEIYFQLLMLKIRHASLSYSASL